MKAIWTFLLLVGVIAVLHSFKLQKKGILTGNFNPSEKVISVWAIDEDYKTRIKLEHGHFSTQLRPGTYKIYIDALSPLNDGLISQITVREEDTTRLGTIFLQ